MSRWLSALLGNNPKVISPDILNEIFKPHIRTHIKYKYRIANGGRIVVTDRSLSDLALAHYKGDIFGLVYDKDLKLIKVRANGSCEDLLIANDSNIHGLVTSGDLFVDQWGIHAIWAETSKCKKGKCASFYYASHSHEEKGFIKSIYPVNNIPFPY